MLEDEIARCDLGPRVHAICALRLVKEGDGTKWFS